MREGFWVPFLIFGSVFGWLAWWSYLSYKETVFLAERGLVKPHESTSGRASLGWGLVLTGIGLALCLGLYPIGWFIGENHMPAHLGPWLLFGLIPMFIGLALVLYYVITRREDDRRSAPEPSPAPLPIAPAMAPTLPALEADTSPIDTPDTSRADNP